MIIKDKVLGKCELEISIEPSSVNSFIISGYSLGLDRELTDDELNDLQSNYAGEIEYYSCENGSINHN